MIIFGGKMNKNDRFKNIGYSHYNKKKRTSFCTHVDYFFYEKEINRDWWEHILKNNTVVSKRLLKFIFKN